MSKSVDQVELAKSKIQSFEKNKNIDSLVSMIRETLFQNYLHLLKMKLALKAKEKCMFTIF